MKAYSVGGYCFHSWIKGAIAANSIKDADVVLLPGGADVWPGWYGEKEGRYTASYKSHDLHEISAYKEALGRHKVIVGICRGEQLLSVMNGAKLIQDLDHPGTHLMTTIDGDEIWVNSLHHQCVNPFNLPEQNYQLLGWAENLSKTHLDGDDRDIFKEPIKEVEAIYFPKTKALGFQYHPEMFSTRYHEALKWTNEMVVRALDGDNFKFAPKQRRLLTM